MGSVKAKALMTPGSGNRGMLCGAARYLNYFLPVRVPHNVWLKAEQLSDMAFLPVWPVESRLLYGPVRARRYDGPHSAFKINVQALCGFPYAFLTGLQNPYGSSMGSFNVLAYRCSKIRMASAQANMTSTCTCPLWKHRCHASFIEIRCFKHTENPQKKALCMRPLDDFTRNSQGRLPKSSGSYVGFVWPKHNT